MKSLFLELQRFTSKYLKALEWHFQNEELPFLGTDGPIWKSAAAVKKNTHIFESRGDVNLEWEHEIL